jgi:hypothetical protein
MEGPAEKLKTLSILSFSFFTGFDFFLLANIIPQTTLKKQGNKRQKRDYFINKITPFRYTLV